MKIFYSSKKLSCDKDLDALFLDIDNIDTVTPNDIVIGVGSFRDELIVKSIINRGVLPFFVTLNIGLDVASTFKSLSFLLNVNDYFVTNETIRKIEEIKSIVSKLNKYNREVEGQNERDEHLKELLINNQRLINSFILKKGQKGVPVEGEKSFEKLYLYERNGVKRKTIYVILQKDEYLKIFSQEVDKQEKVNEILIKNKFRIKFKSLMNSNQLEFSFKDNTFINITSKYKREFLVVDATNKRLLDIELLDMGLKIYSDMAFEEIAIYKLFSRKREIDDTAKELLFSIHNYLQDKNNSINDILPFLRGHNLYEARDDRDKRANITADVFIKFIEKIKNHKEKSKISNFDFAIIALGGDFESFNGDILTNIFYHIVDGIGINAIIKKEFSRFIHNFSAYQDIVEEAEDELEFDECYDGLEEIVDGYPLDKRVMDSKHIESLISCLGDNNELAKSLRRLYDQLTFQEVREYDIENVTTDDTNNSDMVTREGYERIVTIILNSFLNMKDFEGIKTKSLALFMSYLAYRLSLEENEKSTHCCFFAFFNLYANREPEYLLLGLEQYFENRVNSVVLFFEEKKSYSCRGDKVEVTITTIKHGEKIVKCEKFRMQKTRKFKLEFTKVSNFFKLVASTDKMDLAIEDFIDRVVSNQLDTTEYCNHKITIEFLKIFFSVGNKCDVYLDNFFNSIQHEYQNIN